MKDRAENFVAARTRIHGSWSRSGTFAALAVLAIFVSFGFARPAAAYTIPTVQSGEGDGHTTWQAGRNYVEIDSQQYLTDCFAIGICGYSFHKQIRVTDLMTGKRVVHDFGCPAMPDDWFPHWAGVQNFTTSGDGKTLFAVFGMTNHQAQGQKNTATNSDPVCDEVVQWARTVGGSLIETDYPGSPPGSKTMSGYRFLIRSDDGGSSWHLVPPPVSLNMVSGTLVPGDDTVTPGAEQRYSDFVIYPTPSGIAYGSSTGGVAFYENISGTWSDVQPIATTADLANTYLDLPPAKTPLDKDRKKTALAHWRYTDSGNLVVWSRSRSEVAPTRSRAIWLTADGTEIVKRQTISAPRKRLRLQNFSGSVVSLCHPRKLTALSSGLDDAWISDSGRTIWGVTSPYVSLRCTTKNKNLWPKGRLLTDGVAPNLVRSINGGRSWRVLPRNQFVWSYSFASVVENSLVAMFKKCKRADGSNGRRISRLTGTRWKTYGCV